ncbi:hypothetical protein DICVIV_04856 [Dictyocaulus viviparus]|uniref:Uncharacterized protein n=1 Tax=Dictyocaulus viviparus TaxID=29172 RepID=A0A0D8XWI9_DICVI|nr:hypothetical protein DICVIV_04856 [Dictyocaulus viviparus]
MEKKKNGKRRLMDMGTPYAKIHTKIDHTITNRKRCQLGIAVLPPSYRLRYENRASYQGPKNGRKARRKKRTKDVKSSERQVKTDHPIFYELFTRIILNRIGGALLDEEQPREQAGFPKGYIIINVKRGVRQRDISSPKLFTATIGNTMRKVEREKEGIHMPTLIYHEEDWHISREVEDSVSNEQSIPFCPLKQQN